MDYLERYQPLIDDEVSGAKCYAKMYVELKDEHPDEAKKFHEMALQEIKHYEMLNEIAQKMINDEMLQYVFDYLHRQNNRKIADIKIMLTK